MLNRIALLTDGIFPYVVGGMQRHSFYLAKYFAKNKIEVDLYHTNQSEADIHKLELFSEEEKRYINSFIVDFPDFGKIPGHYIRESYEYSRRIFELFRKKSTVDFVYVKGFSGWKLIEEKNKKYKCAPIGVNFHGYEMFQKAASVKSKMEHLLLLRSPVKFNVNNADYVFSYGGKITEIIRKMGVAENQILEIPAGIESSWLLESPSFPNVVRKFLFVGRYERRKGIEELNAALGSMIDRYNFEFHFIGNIPPDKRIVSEKVLYHDMVSGTAQLKQLVDQCDVLVCPSYSEGMPNVILESMSRGLAVIASDVGAVNLLVNELTGWLLTDCSPANISKAFQSVLSESDDKLFMRKQEALNHVKKLFLWENLISDLIGKLNSKIIC